MRKGSGVRGLVALPVLGCVGGVKVGLLVVQL